MLSSDWQKTKIFASGSQSQIPRIVSTTHWSFEP